MRELRVGQRVIIKWEAQVKTEWAALIEWEAQVKIKWDA